MNSDDRRSWRARYEAGQARDDARSAAWVRDQFGGGVGRTLLKQSPLLLTVAAVFLVSFGWRSALATVVLLLCVILLFRGWARRRYGLGRPSGS